MAQLEKSPWGLMDSDTKDKLYKLGVQSLKSGKVQPQEAAQVASRLQSPPGLPQQPNSIAMGVDPSTNANPLSMISQGGMQPRAQTSASDLAQRLPTNPGGGAKAMNESDMKSQSRRISTRFARLSPDEEQVALDQAQGIRHPTTGYKQAVDENGDLRFDSDHKPIYDQDQPIYDMDPTRKQIDPDHPVQQQQAGLAKMQELLQMQADANKGRSTMDWSPLAALADAERNSNGGKSNLAASAKAPEAQTGEFMKYADEIQKRRADIQKSIQENVKNQKNGSTQDMILQALAEKAQAGYAPIQGGYRMETSLMGRVQQGMKELRATDTALAQVSNLLGQWNPTADQGVKVQLAKAIEGYRPQLAAMAAESGDPSLLQRFDTVVERAGTGQMTAEQRGQYMTEIKSLLKTHQEAAHAMKESYRAQNQRLPSPIPESQFELMLNAGTPSAGTANSAMRSIDRPKQVGKPKSLQAPSGPKAGTVEGGYRFKGGDPSDKANWEKQ